MSHAFDNLSICWRVRGVTLESLAQFRRAAGCSSCGFAVWRLSRSKLLVV